MTKKGLFFISLFAFTLMLPVAIHGQCKQFAKKICKVGLDPYQHDGNYHAALLIEGEEAELYKTFYSDTDYRIGVCGASNLADIEKWETEELELLDRADKMKKKMAKLDEKIEEARAELKEIKKRVEETARDYEETIKDLEAKRKAMRDDIAPKVLKDYERIARNRGSSALVKAKKRVCQGCFTTLTKQTENELLKGEEIVHCQNCGRMLTLNKEDSTW